MQKNAPEKEMWFLFLSFLNKRKEAETPNPFQSKTRFQPFCYKTITSKWSSGVETPIGYFHTVDTH